MVYRSMAGVGAIIYEYHQSSITHTSLMKYLGKSDISKLMYDDSKFLSSSIDGGNVFDAFVSDIQNFGVEFLKSSNDQFGNTLKEIATIYKSEMKDSSGPMPLSCYVMLAITLVIILVIGLGISWILLEINK